MADPISLTHPETGEVWTSGKRGRKPLWVCAMMAGEPLPKQTVVVKDTKEAVVPGALRVWKLVGLSGELGDNDMRTQRGHCMIIAEGKLEAVMLANTTFQNPMSGPEFNAMWKELDDDMVSTLHATGMNVTIPSIYESNGDGWKPRPKLH